MGKRMERPRTLLKRVRKRRARGDMGRF